LAFFDFGRPQDAILKLFVLIFPAGVECGSSVIGFRGIDHGRFCVLLQCEQDESQGVEHGGLKVVGGQ
jgi:hypothetical protein